MRIHITGCNFNSSAMVKTIVFSSFSQSLLQEVRSFVLPSKGPGGSVNILERTKSAIVLMRCLPCARAAVLEQICEIFQEAVHKHIVESDRQELLGMTEFPSLQELSGIKQCKRYLKC